MPAPKKLLKAELTEITWTADQQVQVLDKKVPVQFNPETLKLALSNQKAGGDQRGGAATQYVGQGSTKLSFDLWFDVTAAEPDTKTERDVRRLTKDVAYFITPKKQSDGKFIAPGVRFSWGTFLFEGTMESLNETLDYFSEDGRPLRAQLSLSLAQQEIQFKFNEQAAPGSGTSVPGTAPQPQAKAGDTLQSMAAAQGKQDQWQKLALANGIENPRGLRAGLNVNMSASLAAQAGVKAGFGVQAGAPALGVRSGAQVGAPARAAGAFSLSLGAAPGRRR